MKARSNVWLKSNRAAISSQAAGDSSQQFLAWQFGTGNIWRFPREVASNNGGAFILICFCIIYLGSTSYLR